MPLKKISFGQKEDSNIVQKFKGIENIPSIISVIDKSGIMVASLHFANGIGSFHCFEGICCQKEGAPRVRYVIPIVSYRIKNLETFEINTDIKSEVNYLLASADTYETIIKLDEMSDISNMDILVTTENELFQKYTMAPIINEYTGKPRNATWREDEVMRSHILNYYNNIYENKISMSLGKTINHSEYISMKANANANSKTVNRVPDPPVATHNNIPEPPPLEEEDENIPFEPTSEQDIDSLYN